MSPRRLRTAAATDVGLKRKANEDRYAVWERPHGAGGDSGELMIAVCDGMGGSAAGEVASQMTVDAFLRTFDENPGDDPVATLSLAIETANAEIWEHTQVRPDLRGMGTTCTALVMREDEIFIGHVGDSRAYLVRGHRIRQLTRDHSLVAQLVTQGHLTPQEARTDSRRNLVTRSVGVAPKVESDVVRIDEAILAGDTLLLCTDGLHVQVADDEMARIAANESLTTACRELVRLANQRGGPDNITVVMARCEPEAEVAESQQGRRHATVAPTATGPSRRRLLVMLIAALVVLLLVLCGLAWIVFGRARGDRAVTAMQTDVGESTS